MRSIALSLSLVAAAAMLWPAAVARAIINGRPDVDGLYPYVGLVTNLGFVPAERAAVCSGAAISPVLLVTAAHCFDAPGGRVSITFDQQGLFAQNPAFVTGTWHPDPNFCLGCGPGLPGFDRHDVAVVVLDQPVPLPRYALLPAPGLAGSQPMGAEVTIVGYGVQDRLRRLDPGGLFTRYFAPSQLIQSEHVFGDQFLKLSADPAHGGGFCFGDSGGPVLLQGTDTMLAVNSFVNNVNCAGVTYHYRLDTAEALDFINPFLTAGRDPLP